MSPARLLPADPDRDAPAAAAAMTAHIDLVSDVPLLTDGD